MFTARKDNIIDKVGVNATFGGNLMERKSSGLKNHASKLTVPNLFTINNSSNADRSVTETYNHKKINSLYGTVGFNYDGWVFWMLHSVMTGLLLCQKKIVRSSILLYLFHGYSVI